MGCSQAVSLTVPLYRPAPSPWRSKLSIASFEGHQQCITDAQTAGHESPES